MATTKIWKVTGSLPKLINYISNPDKTAGGLLITGVNCSLQTAVMEMEAVKTQYGKNSGTTAFHAYQSFVEGEVTAMTAHEIGVKLAESQLGNRFQVLVSTHTDHENHIHNHFMWNSVSHTDGLRYNHDKAVYRSFRNESDRLCREHKLSVIKQPSSHKTKSYDAWNAAKEGTPTVRESRHLNSSKHPVLPQQVMHQIGKRVEEFPYQGLIRQHYHYSLLIMAYSTIPAKRLNPNLNSEVLMLEIILRQTEMLITNTLDTITKLLEFKLQKQQRIPLLIKERSRLYRIIAKGDNAIETAEARQRLKEIGCEHKVLRTQIRDCDDIEQREDILDERIKEHTSLLRGRKLDRRQGR
ncbi:MAG: relaxase/mobilization nuclease domain-containing protein [Coriobacteriia bacterium]|nr:relaxase/mobilization nuclease domain-containing protein [Coriobacteriia bacterium]MCL2750180.1 relaxase/mobilization nuclease domain-containing protein [Coriobacteriia bacterium]